MAKSEVHVWEVDGEWGYDFRIKGEVFSRWHFENEAEAVSAAETKYKQVIKSQPRKPVIEVTVHEMWDYEFQAKHPLNGKILASNSLDNLKRDVKDRGWKMAYLTCSNGVFAHNQSVINEYPFEPKHNRSRR